MECEVAVVGGGIGGLTVAALLAERGVNVCLLERQPQVGGCAANFEQFGYSFEPGDGLYPSWQAGEIYDRVFAELPVDAPEVRLLEPGYLVRLPDQSEIQLSSQTEQFELQLRQRFPECAGAAVAFYRKLEQVGGALRRALRRTPDLLSSSRARRTYKLLPEGKIAAEIFRASQQSALDELQGTSFRFRRFIDLQLQALAQGGSAEVPYLQAALALSSTREGMFAIRGGAAALANTLALSIRKSGGKVRVDTPVLRLTYDSSGTPVGVDLLSGETVKASQAIVSNLTIWDTYGKLVGLNRTPADIRKQLSQLRSWGAFLIYLAMDEQTTSSMPSDHLMLLADWQEGQDYDPEADQLLFAAAPSWDARAPQGKRAVTVHAWTDVDSWFTFHKDDTELEKRDQGMLELCWARLHKVMPELGDSVEVIDSATPRTYYDLTRRKLGMVGTLNPLPISFWLNGPSHQTPFPNVHLVSDTVYPDGLAGLTRSALVLANHLTRK